MLDAQNCLQHHIKNAKATKFLSQSVFYTSKGRTCKVFAFSTAFGFKLYDKFCRTSPIVNFLTGHQALHFILCLKIQSWTKVFSDTCSIPPSSWELTTQLINSQVLICIIICYKPKGNIIILLFPLELKSNSISVEKP